MRIFAENELFSTRIVLKSALRCAWDTMTNQKIGQQLRARRKFLRLRQRDLAELAGVTLRGLTELENGRGNPTVNQLAKIAEVLGLEFTLIERPLHAPS